MRYFLLLAALPILLSFCQKGTLATKEQQSILVYTSSILTKPLIINDGFYFLASDNKLLYLSSVTPGGTFSKLLNISTLLPSGYTIDSLSSIKINALQNQDIVIAYTYKYGQRQMISILKTNKGGQLLWQKTDSIKNTQQILAFKALCHTETGEINIVLSSFIPGNSSVLQENIISSANGESITTINNIVNGNVSTVLPLNSAGFIYFSSKSQGGPTGGGGLTKSSLLTRYKQPGKYDTLSLALEINDIYEVYENNTELIISALEGNPRDGLKQIIMSTNLTSGITWQTTQTLSSFSILNIQKTANGYYLAGLKLDGLKFEWNNATIQEDAEMAQGKIDLNGNLIWSKNLTQQGMIAYSVFENSDGSLCWLGSMINHSVLQNTVLLKTNSNGEITNK